MDSPAANAPAPAPAPAPAGPAAAEPGSEPALQITIPVNTTAQTDEAKGLTSPAENTGLVGDKKEQKEEKKEEAKSVPYGALFRYATTTDKLLMFFGTIGAMGNGASLPLFAIVFGEILNAFVLPFDQLMDKVETMSLWFVAIGAGSLVCSWLEVGFWMIAAERQAKRLREEYLKALLRQDVTWFDKNDAGAQAVRLTNDTKQVQTAIGEKVGNYVHHMSTFFSGLIIGFIKGWQLALVILSVVPLLAIAGGCMAKFMQDSSEQGQRKYAEAGSIAEEAITSLRTVFAFSGEEREKAKYDEKLDGALAAGVKSAKIQGSAIGTTMFILFGSYGLSLWFGAYLVRERISNAYTGNDYTGGDVVSVFFGVLIGAMSLGQAAPNIPAFTAGKVSGYVLFEVIDRKSEVDVFDPSGETIADLKGNIKFENVDFYYPTRTEVKIFNRLCLDINAGETVALVGSSGCGKSTIVGLLERFYDPIKGSVTVDGVELKKLNVKWWRKQVGLVGQEPRLFATSIKENIRYGNAAATDDDITEACKRANAHDFIMNLPKKYDTIVGDMGSLLSGGQKQRIAIARAIVKNPKILLLDEATSALDNESEKVVQAALDKLMVNHTTIVIAHRLSTIVNATRIVVFQDGRVIEQGKYQELIDRNGAFAALVRAQEAAQKHAEDEKKQSEEKANVVSQTGPNQSTKRQVSVKSADKTAQDNAKQELEKLPEVPLGRVLSLNKPEALYVVAGAFAASANGVTMPMFSIIFADMLNIFYEPDPEKMKSDSAMLAIYFAILGVGMFLVNLFQTSSLSIAGEHLTKRLRSMSFAAMMRQHVGWFDDEKHGSGIVLTQLATDAEAVHGLTNERIAQVFQIVAMLTAALIIAFINGWKLALVVLSVGPLIMFAGYIQLKFVGGFSGQTKEALEDAGKQAIEAISNIRTVASFTAEEQIVTHYSQLLESPLNIGVRAGHVSGFSFGFSNAVLFFAYALSFWYGATLVRDGEMTLEKVLKVFFAITLAAMGVGQTSQLAPDYAKAKVAAKSIFYLVDSKSEIDPTLDSGSKEPLREGRIQLKDVHFSYPTRADVQIFKGLTLDIPPGKSVALVGPSGSGKSTIIGLIERFYNPTKGDVIIDGKSVKDYHLRSLRSQIGLVQQEPILFNTTIGENIRYGKPDATQAEIEAAAKEANIHEMIMKQPKGYDTNVGAKGVLLSGGQKQRIAIARAIIRKPKVLLFDEATSALDAESEKVVQEALDKIRVNTTTVIVAHRLSTIRNCDIIAVLSGGQIVEIGDHNSLMEKRSVYFNLVQAHEH